ncbi:MAG: ribonuclease P protein component [Candidatus Harrisonbacteria bacterium]|nr:ribonuclease P protein component [Candidatus Harrisonbacteria bacterium]
MLAKRYKLPIQKFVGKRGQLRKTPYFLLKNFITKLPHSRFGITVSVKVSKRATGRNRLRRMVYNFVRERLKTIKLGDYWISILPPAAELSREKFIAELIKILEIRN